MKFNRLPQEFNWLEVFKGYALRAARQREKTEAFSDTYKQRAGIEGTISQGTRGCGLAFGGHFI